MTNPDQPQPCVLARPLSLTVEVEPDPLNDLLAARLVLLVLQELWTHGSHGRIQLGDQLPCPRRPHHRP
jgi:hypothetical protein